MRLALVDYGSGNLHSAAKAFERASREAGLDETVAVTSDPDTLSRADRIVLPGVGAFADCRAGLDAVPGLVDALEESVRKRGRPFLGICVGMQLMASRGPRTPHHRRVRLDSRRRRSYRPRRCAPQDPAYGLEHP